MPDARERFTDLGYREAVSQPIAGVERIYDALGLELRPEARGAMEGWLARDARAARPAHPYSADRYGLSESEIREAFADYMIRYIEPEVPSERVPEES
jgi:hypothetical protein